MKIVQFGLPYSPNVGDGIIAETLGYAIRQSVPGVDFRSIDISGRTDFGAQTVRNRTLALAVLDQLPAPLRGRLVEARLNRMLNRAEDGWRAAIRGADLAILGGGQIFSDADLNFCTKVARVARIVRAAGVPLAVHAAGVSRNWSQRGTALFAEIFSTDLRIVGLRDALSVEAWVAQVEGKGPGPVLTRDPGLLAAELYRGTCDPVDVIGLGITAPRVLRYHADSAVTGGTDAAYFADIAVALAGRGHKVRLFCNGAIEDAAALAQVAAIPAVAALIREGRVEAAARPLQPADLAALVRDCRAVVAHRLHACIVAWAYRVPVVGLGWDRKLESFLASVGEEAGFVDAGAAAPSSVADRAEARIAAGTDPAWHARVLDETRAGVAAVLAAV